MLEIISLLCNHSGLWLWYVLFACENVPKPLDWGWSTFYLRVLIHSSWYTRFSFLGPPPHSGHAEGKRPRKAISKGSGLARAAPRTGPDRCFDYSVSRDLSVAFAKGRNPLTGCGELAAPDRSRPTLRLDIGLFPPAPVLCPPPPPPPF